MSIIQIATSVGFDMHGTEIKRTVCVDENGNAWELHGSKWAALPGLPFCACVVQKDTANCAYHKALKNSPAG